LLTFATQTVLTNGRFTSGFPISKRGSSAKAAASDIRPDFHWKVQPVAAMGYP